jgi:hypothetical protein
MVLTRHLLVRMVNHCSRQITQLVVMLGAGTFSNAITDVFSIAAITKAQAQASRFVTFDGLPFLCQFDLVLVSPELESEGKRIFWARCESLFLSLQRMALILYTG